MTTTPTAIGVLLASGVLSTVAAAEPTAPTALLTEFMESPLAIDQLQPRFSWAIGDAGRGSRQAAFQLLVASGKDQLDRDQADLWDSGKVAVSDSTAVKYAGQPLSRANRYWWKVRVWDKDGRASPYSAAARFDVGLGVADWTAKHIWDGTQDPNNFAYFRKEFTLPAGKKVVGAKLFVSAHNVYRLFLNGRELGYGPARSNPGVYGQYNAYDLTETLAAGPHVLAAMCHWQGTWRDSGVNAQPSFIAELRLTYSDGTAGAIITDAGWQVLAQTPYDEKQPVFFGSAGGVRNRCAERYDARKEPVGWMQAGFAAQGWVSATEVKRDYKLFAQVTPRSRIQQEVAPVSLRRDGDVWKVDFGRNRYAIPRITMTGNQPGDVIRLSYFSDADCKHSRQHGWDEYTCRGGGAETYEKWNGWGGIRSMTVSGYRGELKGEHVRALVRFSEADKQGDFSCSDPQLNDIYGLCEWTSRMATQEGGFYDDDVTEQSSWGCDGYTGGRNLFYSIRNYRVQNKTLRDYIAEQNADGMIYACSPARAFHLPDFSLNLYQSAWEYHLFYNDLTLLEDTYPGLRKFLIEYIGKRRDPKTGLSNVKGKGWADCYSTSDWNPDYLDFKGVGAALTVHNMLYYNALRVMSRFAIDLGRAEDAREFEKIAADLKVAINNHLFDGVEKYRDGIDSKAFHLLCSVWAIHNDIVPDDKRDAVLKYIREYKGYGLELASIGACVFFDTMYPLGTEGERLLAYLKHPERWVRMIPNYCTTENIAGAGLSLAVLPNAPGTVLPKFVGGVRPTSPGFKTFDIKPTIDGLEHATVTVPTVKGKVTVHWRKMPNAAGLTLDAVVPANTTAHVYLPKGTWTEIVVREGKAIVWQQGKFVPGTAGITAGEDAGRWIRLTIGSGTYAFAVASAHESKPGHVKPWTSTPGERR
jgi:alpha-L-rhamnosidase